MHPKDCLVLLFAIPFSGVSFILSKRTVLFCATGFGLHFKFPTTHKFSPREFLKIQNRAGQPHHHFFVTKTCQVCQHKPGTKINLFSWSHWNTTNCVSWTQENFFLSTTELGFLQMKKQPKLSSTLLTSLDTTKS